jgi:hypothetical protein
VWYGSGINRERQSGRARRTVEIRSVGCSVASSVGANVQYQTNLHLGRQIETAVGARPSPRAACRFSRHSQPAPSSCWPRIHALQLFGRPCPDSYSRPPPCYAFFVFVFCAGTLRFHSCGSVFRRVLETHTMGTSCYSRLGCGAPRDDLASSELPQSRCLANLLCPGTDVCTTGPTLIYAASSGQAELSRPLLLAGERDLRLRVVAQLTFLATGFWFYSVRQSGDTVS